MTIKEIAELAKVSSATVSKVMNGKDSHISETTRQRILEIIKKEGYIPNGIAKSLKVKRTKTIGIIMPDVMNQFFSELARGAEDAADLKGYSVILCNTDNKVEKEESYIQILQEKMVDGIILTATENSSNNSLEKCKIPMVLVDRNVEFNKNVGRIIVENKEPAYRATEYLIKKGCTNIGFISSEILNRPSEDRLKGYMEALMNYGYLFDQNKIYLNNFTIESGYLGIKTLMKRANIDGVFCGNDLIAIGAIKALKEDNIKVPEHVKVVGFDDIAISQFVDPPLTTIKQPIYKMGEEAVNMLVDIIEKKNTDMTKILTGILVERESS